MNYTIILVLLMLLLIVYIQRESFANSLTKTYLTVICSKNPDETLLENVNAVKKFYPEFDIVIVDSNSDEFKGYENIPKDVKIEYVKNENYELGAWYYAVNKYPYYDYYMLIQDTFIPTSRIKDFDLTNGTTYTRFIYNNYLNDGPGVDELRAVYTNSDLDFLVKKNINEKFIGGAHSSFIADNETTKNIIQLEKPYIDKGITKTKMDSLLTERTVGIMADIYSKKRIDMEPYFKKINRGRYIIKNNRYI